MTVVTTRLPWQMRCVVLAVACAAVPGLAGEVDTLLQTPREHPYLFFSAEDIPAMRERMATEPWSQAADLIVRSAEAAVTADIPPEPDEGPDQPRDEQGNYTAYYLRIHYEFYDAGHAINDIVPTLAMAWLLTGEQRFADRAKQWMLHYSTWQQWSVKSALADNQSAHSYMGLAIGYDWLYDQLADDERAQIQDGLRRLGETFQTHRGGLAEQALPGHRGGIANNHTWVSHAAPAVGALAQLYEEPQARRWLETEIICWRDKILPSSIGRDGEYIDGSGGWLTYCLQNGLLFLAAMRRNGCDLYEGSNLDRVADFIVRDRELLAEDASLPPYDVRYSLLELASRYDDSETQWIALANGLGLSSSAHSRRWPGSGGIITPPYEPNTWYHVRLEWDAATQRFRTTIDGRLLEDMPMLDREFASIDRFAFMGHWRTDCVVDIRGLRVLDLSADEARPVLTLADLGEGELQAGGDIGIRPPDAQIVEVIPGEEPILRFTDASDDQAGMLSFALPPLTHGAIEFELRKSDNDASYFYLRTWDGDREMRGMIWYIDRRVKKHMPDYRNQDWPFGWEPGAVGPWYPAVFEFLFYDPEVTPQPPDRGRPSVAFRDLGWVKMRSDWSQDAVSIFFRSGPEMGKDHGDNNAFRMRAFGEDILPDLPTPPSGESQLTQTQYDLYAWFQGTNAHNTILPGGHTQPAVWGDQTGRQYGAQWLAEPGEGITPRGRLTSVLLASACDYASGEAAPAYTRAEPVLNGFRRDILFIKPDVAIVYDELASAAEPLLYHWLLHAVRPIGVQDTAAGPGRMVVRGEKATLYATPLFPADAQIDILTTPAPLERDRTRYFSMHAPAPTDRQRFLVVLQPVRADSEAEPPAPERVEGDGCVGAICAREGMVDRAVFLESAAKFGEVAGCSVRGRAAWVRARESEAPREFALLSGTELSADGRVLAHLAAPGNVALSIAPGEAGPEAFEVTASLLEAGMAEVRLPAQPSRLQAEDGTEVAVNYADGLLRLTLPAGESTVRGEF